MQQIPTPKKTKEKVITFRLTNDDLKQYEQFCIDEQIRMSELIRQALKTKVQVLDEMPRIEFKTV